MKKNAPTAEEVMADFSVHNWVKDALAVALKKDPVDAAHGAALLSAVLDRRCEEMHQALMLSLGRPDAGGSTDRLALALADEFGPDLDVADDVAVAGVLIELVIARLAGNAGTAGAYSNAIATRDALYTIRSDLNRFASAEPGQASPTQEI